MSVEVSNPKDLRQRLEQLTGSDLAAVNSVLTRQFRNPNAFVQDICNHVARYHGKQIRPILVILSARTTGLQQHQTARAHTFGAVVEMIHTATLVHDDVIDDADIRRHVSTVHRRWNTETSVLLGDYLFSKAFHLAATTGDAEACALIGRATDRTCEGELNQIAARLEHSTSEADYFRVIAGKTGQLFSVSCVLGARAAEATAMQTLRLQRFGLRLGMAFQIADDLLDLTQPHDVTGKDAANDLQNRRLTLPLLRALRLSDEQERHWLLGRLQSDDPDERLKLPEHAAVQRGLESAQNTAEELVRRCLRSLQSLPDCSERQLLEAIARFAVRRCS